MTRAQRNYHIVRLELLAFVSSSMTGWRGSVLYGARTVGHTNFCTKHPYHRIPQLRGMPWRTLTTVEWILGVSMTADSFSRMAMVVSEESGEALSLPELVFGRTIGDD